MDWLDELCGGEMVQVSYNGMAWSSEAEDEEIELESEERSQLDVVPGTV